MGWIASTFGSAAIFANILKSMAAEFAWEETPIPNTTKNSKIGSVEALKKIIDNAHKRGAKNLLRRSIRRLDRVDVPDQHGPSDIQSRSNEPSLCHRIKKLCRRCTNTMSKSSPRLSEADGVFIESTDEYGECQCGSIAAASWMIWEASSLARSIGPLRKDHEGRLENQTDC